MGGHALYGSGEADASRALLWARPHLFRANNYAAMLEFLLSGPKVGGVGDPGSAWRDLTSDVDERWALL